MSANLYTVFSPEGERFEVSKANYNDLITHLGWTTGGPAAGAAAPAPAAAEVNPPAAPAAPQAEVTPPATTQTEEQSDGDVSDDSSEDANEGEAEAAVSDEASEVLTEEPKARTTVEDFADLIEKADVAAYIAKTFPAAKIDGRTNRDGLIAQAIELAIPTA